MNDSGGKKLFCLWTLWVCLGWIWVVLSMYFCLWLFKFSVVMCSLVLLSLCAFTWVFINLWCHHADGVLFGVLNAQCSAAKLIHSTGIFEFSFDWYNKLTWSLCRKQVYPSLFMSAAPLADYYDMLGVRKNATASEIKKAYYGVFYMKSSCSWFIIQGFQ